MLAIADVPKTPDAPDDLVAQPLGQGIALEDAAVTEAKRVEAFGLRRRVELSYFGQEVLRILQLREDGLQRPVVVPALQDLRRNPPHAGEALVEANDPSLAIDDEQAVGRRLERRLQQGQRVVPRRLSLVARGDVAHDAEAFDEAAGPVEDGVGGDEHAEVGAVFAAEHGLELRGLALEAFPNASMATSIDSGGTKSRKLRPSTWSRAYPQHGRHGGVDFQGDALGIAAPDALRRVGKEASQAGGRFIRSGRPAALEGSNAAKQGEDSDQPRGGEQSEHRGRHFLSGGVSGVPSSGAGGACPSGGAAASWARGPGREGPASSRTTRDGPSR